MDTSATGAFPVFSGGKLKRPTVRIRASNLGDALDLAESNYVGSQIEDDSSSCTFKMTVIRDDNDNDEKDHNRDTSTN
jgi:hypothetical protein